MGADGTQTYNAGYICKRNDSKNVGTSILTLEIYSPCSIWAFEIPVFLRIGSILIEQVFPHLHHVAD